MKTVGIIAEYNPFHNGHEYQLKEAKKTTSADYCIVVMSGDFTQRGTPAIVDKYARCEMALQAGADLVIELPVCFATASAEYFAEGAVSILDRLHVNTLCFGSECGDIDLLQTIANLFEEESELFKNELKHYLKSGLSYPFARSKAIGKCLKNISDDELPEIENLLKCPNNTLGIEYLKAIRSRKSKMEAFTIKRKGSSYLNEELTEASFSSAQAIRKHLFAQKSPESIIKHIPESSVSILKNEMENGFPISINDFSTILYYQLLCHKTEGYDSFWDISSSLSNKIKKNLEHYGCYTSFSNELLKSKDLTQSRICRGLLHILLNMKETDYSLCKEAAYARILGFRKEAQPLFSSFKEIDFPIISKMADAEKKLDSKSLSMLQLDVFAAHLYDGIAAEKVNRFVRNEYQQSIIII